VADLARVEKHRRSETGGVNREEDTKIFQPNELRRPIACAERRFGSGYTGLLASSIDLFAKGIRSFSTEDDPMSRNVKRTHNRLFERAYLPSQTVSSPSFGLLMHLSIRPFYRLCSRTARPCVAGGGRPFASWQGSLISTETDLHRDQSLLCLGEIDSDKRSH
jgi:hypothetical protein